MKAGFENSEPTAITVCKRMEDTRLGHCTQEACDLVEELATKTMAVMDVARFNNYSEGLLALSLLPSGFVFRAILAGCP